MDVNNDGKISVSEAKNRMKDHFSEIDLNSNGNITKEEMQKAPRPNRQELPPQNR